MSLSDQIRHSIEESIRAIETLRGKKAEEFLEKSAHLIVSTFKKGGKLLICGNGGSHSDAAHFAEELTGSFRKKRMALPAIVLGDAAHITCVGNDFGFEEIFSRGVEALGKEGDLFCGLSTSGNSPNIVRALSEAKERGLKTMAFLGKGGGKIKGMADLEWIVEGDFPHSDRIQEVHMAMLHILIEGVESLLFGAASPYDAKAERVLRK
jgi:D-sedoheptulose 7-phosphate isomerase